MIETIRTAALGLILVVACGPAAVGRPDVSPTTPPSPTASPAASASPTPVPTNDPRAQGATSASLASRASPDPLYERPYVGAYELPNQPPGGTLEHGALPSIWYVTKGTVRWTTTSGTVIDVGTGEAAATPTLGFVESNPGTTSNSAYGFLVYATQSRLLLSNQVQREIVASPTLPLPQPAGPYTLRLELVTLQGAGRTAAASHAGAAVLVVLEGDIELRQQDGKHEYLASGRGTSVMPGSSMQVFNRGSASARVLEFFYTPDSKPFETLLSSPL
ncbi:MAG: hypothetical protein E6I51_07260 [Chloroflexi bacterium]|nr:MAG: hypothetical protein E6I51_07260 [Chloroflexota bacterium]